MAQKMCGTKHASFGMAADGKRLWCGGCGKPKDAVFLGTPRKRAAPNTDGRHAALEARLAAAVETGIACVCFDTAA